MKVLLINKNHFVVGGADSVYLNTGNLLKSKGVEVIYFSTKNINNLVYEKSHHFANEVLTRNIPTLKKIRNTFKYLFNYENIIKLNKLILDEKPDIAHLHLFYGTLSSSILFSLKRNKIPIIVTIHDYRLLCPSNAMIDSNNTICEKCANSSYYNCILLKCSEKNVIQSIIVTIEAYLRKFVINPFNFISHFIFVSKFSYHKHIFYDNRFLNNSSHLYNYYDNKTNIYSIKGEYFLYYGRLSKEKGIETLINSFKNLKLNLVIAGTGPLSNYVQSESHNSGNIKYVGFKTGNDLEKLILNSSFVIVPSEWYENNPMTIIESFSLGKPVIGSKIGGIPELLYPNNGILFEPFNINDLISKIKQADTISFDNYNLMSKNCLQFSKTYFNKETYFNILYNLYQKVINDFKEINN